MTKILVSDKLDKGGLDILARAEGLEVDVQPAISPEDLRKVIGGYDGLLIRSRTKVTAEIIAAADRLKVIGRAGIGVDNVDLAAASTRGIVVMNTPLANTITTAEHAVSMMLALARQIPQATASVKAGKWEKTKFTGVELYRKVLGVVGLGNIGSIVARRGLGLEMQVIAYDPFITREKADALGVEVVELDELFRRADFITVHTPVNEETRNLISARTIALMKKGVRIINCARGGIVNEADLAAAIAEGKVAGAALDVFASEPPEAGNPLLGLEQVICTPHLGASTTEAQENVSLAVAEQVIDFFKGTVRNAVNMPSLDAETMARLKPYLDLARRLGLFLGQLIDGRMASINLTYCGEVAGQDLRPVTMTLLEGILRPVVGEVVNLVNAPFLAKERGIKVSETTRAESEDFASLIQATLVTDRGETSVAGTLITGRRPRIVGLNGCDLEAVPEGDMLVFYNDDQPGVIGKMGTLLGDSAVNIGGMQLGRRAGRREAVAILNIDSRVPEPVMEKIRALPFIHFARQVRL